MSYQTYTTEALVCGSKDSYTSDRSYLLFTEQGGILWATARSVREERSRQRYALQDFSHVRVSLVRGRAGWRIGSVSALQNPFQAAPDRVQRGAVTQVIRLLRQFVHGEEPHPALFGDTIAVLTAITTTAADLDTIVDVYMLRLLHHLGYIAPESSYAHLLTSDQWLQEGASFPKAAHQAIQEAQKVSHL